MSISAIENLAAAIPTDKTASQETMRRTAQQFEAILLMQLTSAMNGTGDKDSDEDSLFGGDGGTDLAKKMFSEQMATTISQSGGVGLADLIMQQMGATQPKVNSAKTNNLLNVAAAVKDIKESGKVKVLSGSDIIGTMTNKTAQSKNRISIDDSNELEIIPSYLDAPNAGNDNYSKLLTLDGKILNSTRPRVVPDYALNNNNPLSVDSMNSASENVEKVQFQMPVKGRISSSFGTRFHPIDRKTKFHGGIDIAVPRGTSIGASADGIVKFAGWKGGYGYAVIIEHADGTETLYGHNEKLLVKEGQQVNAGEPISLSGSTGKSTGPHLHFEVRQNGRAIDPQKFLSNVLPNDADRQE